MYNEIIDFVYNRLEDVEKPEVFTWDADTFACYPDDNVVAVPEDCADISRLKGFYKKFIVKFFRNHYNFILSENTCVVFCILHEIGHIITSKGMNASLLYETYDKLYESLEDGGTKSDYELDVLYRLNPFEVLADSWAMAFITMYPEILEITDDKQLILN